MSNTKYIDELINDILGTDGQYEGDDYWIDKANTYGQTVEGLLSTANTEEEFQRVNSLIEKFPTANPILDASVTDWQDSYSQVKEGYEMYQTAFNQAQGFIKDMDFLLGANNPDTNKPYTQEEIFQKIGKWDFDRVRNHSIKMNEIATGLSLGANDAGGFSKPSDANVLRQFTQATKIFQNMMYLANQEQLTREAKITEGLLDTNEAVEWFVPLFDQEDIAMILSGDPQLIETLRKDNMDKINNLYTYHQKRNSDINKIQRKFFEQLTEDRISKIQEDDGLGTIMDKNQINAFMMANYTDPNSFQNNYQAWVEAAENLKGEELQKHINNFKTQLSLWQDEELKAMNRANAKMIKYTKGGTPYGPIYRPLSDVQGLKTYDVGAVWESDGELIPIADQDLFGEIDPGHLADPLKANQATTQQGANPNQFGVLQKGDDEFIYKVKKFHFL